MSISIGSPVRSLLNFSVSKRKARKGRNPQTGEVIKIKAKKVVKFSPGAGLKKSV